MNNDSRTAVIHTAGMFYVLQARPPALLALSSDGKTSKTLVGNLGGTPDGIQVDVARRTIFWTNMGEDYAAPDGTIECCDLDGTNRRLLVGHGLVTTPKQIALDRQAGLLYWCDREGMRVMRSNLQGSDVTVLIQTGKPVDQKDETHHCVGIALDQTHRNLYWTQKGPPDAGKGRIFRAAIDLPRGARPDARPDIELLAEGLPEPIDLEIDHELGVLYWTDRGNLTDGNTLNSARIASSGLLDRKVLARGLEEGIGVALDLPGRQAFVTDLSGKVRVVDLDSGDTRTLLSAGPLTGIAFVRQA